MRAFRGKAELESLLDENFDGSLTIYDLADLCGKTGEAIRRNIITLGKEDWFKRKRKEYRHSCNAQKELSITAKRDFCTCLSEMAYEKGNWALKRTIEYIGKYKNRPNRYISSDRLYLFFTVYHQHLQSGKQVTLKQLSKETGFEYSMTVRRILLKMNLPFLHKTNGKSSKNRLEISI